MQPDSAMKLYKQPSINLKWTATLTALSILSQVGIFPYIFNFLSPKLTPVITLPDGQVQGKVAYSQNGTEYWQFMGVPYAEPPLGKLRFQPPVPVRPWEGVKKTVRQPPLCTQFESVARLRLLGQEDCLYLNVFTPPLSHGDLHPVLVNIPGGGFVFGGAEYYGPGRFMNHQDIVLVTFNYRVGAQGFLNFAESSTDKDDLNLPRGNMGIKDMRLVLQWVQKNIANFGGDPGRVNVYGQSAGGIALNFLMLSNTTNKLFHRVIVHSGAAISGWSFERYPARLANNLVSKLGCPVENKQELMECLVNADPYEMASYSICPINPTVDQDIFVPSIETVITDDTFFSEHPYKLLEKGVSPNIPFMLGVNTGDGALRSGRFDRRPEYIKIIDENWDDRLCGLTGLKNLPASVAQQVRRFYFPPGNKSFTEDPQFFKDGLVKLISDTGAYEAVHTVAKAHSYKNGSAPTYMFIYDYLPTRAPGIYSLYAAVDPDDWLLAEVKICWSIVVDWVNEHVFGRLGAHRYGAIHAEEMFILWDMTPLLELLGFVHSTEDVEFSNAFINVMLDFARGKEDISFRGVPWPTINAANQANQPFPYMLLNKTGYGQVIPEPFTDRIRFWESIGIRNYT